MASTTVPESLAGNQQDIPAVQQEEPVPKVVPPSEVKAATQKAQEAENTLHPATVPAPPTSVEPATLQANVAPQLSAEVHPVSPATLSGAQPEGNMEPEAVAGGGAPRWPQLDDLHPISLFREALPAILESASYNEVYGLHLSVKPEDTFKTNLILQKFLRANSNDLEKAKTQLQRTLEWRRDFKPLECIKRSYSQERFGALGYVAKLDNGSKTEVITFNIYGAVKDRQKTFGDLEEFLRWRVALMEKSLQMLELDKATKPIPDFETGEPDPYRALQVHDYDTLSFFRQEAVVKAASKRVIDIMVEYYPETLSRKFFVNVPTAAAWVYKFTCLLLPKATTSKFVLCSDGKELAGYLDEFKQELPGEYGGANLGSLDVIGTQLNLVHTESEPNVESKEKETSTSGIAPATDRAQAETSTKMVENPIISISEPTPDPPAELDPVSAEQELETAVQNLELKDVSTGAASASAPLEQPKPGAAV